MKIIIKELKEVFGLIGAILLSPIVLFIFILLVIVFKIYEDEIEQWFFGQYEEDIKEELKENPIKDLNMYINIDKKDTKIKINIDSKQLKKDIEDGKFE